MNVKELESLFADKVTVQAGKYDFVLKAPTTPEAMAILSRFGEKASKLPEGGDGRAPYFEAITEGLELTLEVSDGDLPEGIGSRILLATGGFGSPLVGAVARLIGLPLLGETAREDDTPFGSDG